MVTFVSALTFNYGPLSLTPSVVVDSYFNLSIVSSFLRLSLMYTRTLTLNGLPPPSPYLNTLAAVAAVTISPIGHPLIWFTILIPLPLLVDPYAGYLSLTPDLFW